MGSLCAVAVGVPMIGIEVFPSGFSETTLWPIYAFPHVVPLEVEKFAGFLQSMFCAALICLLGLSLALPWVSRHCDVRNPLVLIPMLLALTIATSVCLGYLGGSSFAQHNITVTFQGYAQEVVIQPLRRLVGFYVLTILTALMWIAWWPWVLTFLRKLLHPVKHSHPIDRWCMANESWLLPLLGVGLVLIWTQVEIVWDFISLDVGVPLYQLIFGSILYGAFYAVPLYLVIRLTHWLAHRVIMKRFVHDVVWGVTLAATAFALLGVHDLFRYP